MAENRQHGARNIPNARDRQYTLMAIINNEYQCPRSLSDFEHFLSNKEHSEENLEFLLAVKEFSAYCATLSNPTDPAAPGYADCLKRAKQVADKFLVAGAAKEINCPNAIRKKVIAELSEGKCNSAIFAETVEKQMYLMQQSSYPHFLRDVDARAGEVCPKHGTPTPP
jgi:hypothetical protein